MKNKEIQEQRMKGYFLEAAKELLKAEGLKSISVRNIAERAGYSYATLYSYFRDLNELIFLCVQDFYEECKEQVQQVTRKKEKGIKKLKAAIRAYADFFIQYPGIFDLFFTETIGNAPNKKQVLELIQHSLDSICEEDWHYCMSWGLLPGDRIGLMKSQLRHSLLGLLLLYLNRSTPASYVDFVSRFNVLVNAIIDDHLPGAMAAGRQTTVNNALISVKIGNNK
ncbi:TetR/AcrR family transcriptional regulator [Taibaiella helva]|uniref:TetR/AcrR family transcriptional regulator n=1 Tax=Taibaiella helva TaxID=2301235 RepID=UPI000E57FF70|nr:TetR/AcrR family transcriptional regulator [Taibaiella helva]